jgi:hypothetical protein
MVKILVDKVGCGVSSRTPTMHCAMLARRDGIVAFVVPQAHAH